MTTRDFLAALRERDACAEGYAWARTNKIADATEAWARLPRADWMFWLAPRFGIEIDPDMLRRYAYECADRAVRIHAVAALRAAGLGAQADTLAALPKIVDKKTARAAYSAADAANAAYAAAYAASAASAADERLWQADRLRTLMVGVP